MATLVTHPSMWHEDWHQKKMIILKVNLIFLVLAIIPVDYDNMLQTHCRDFLVIQH